MASKANLTIYQGSAPTWDIVVSVDGSAYDLTGATTTDLTFRAGVKGDESQIAAQIGAGITLTTAASGEVQLTIPAADTSLSAGVYRYELWLDHGTVQDAVLVGSFTVLDSLHEAD